MSRMSVSNRRMIGDTIRDTSWLRQVQEADIRCSYLSETSEEIPESQTQTIEESGQQSTAHLICVNEIRVSSPNELKIGDHVVFQRPFYKHHAIITGKNTQCQFEVIEATTTSVLGKAKLIRSSQTIDFTKDTVSRVNYSSRFSHTETANRAKKFYTNEFKYNLFTNNCEHFATNCCTGERYSRQVADFVFSGLNASTKTQCGAQMECIKYVCIPSVDIKSKHDVTEGDIIKYFIDGLWHHAVVLQIKRRLKKKLKCTVAHYASCAQIPRRRVKEKDLDILFEKSFYKLLFEPSKFNIEEPDVVVLKTKKSKRTYEFRTNECSQFPIWCKLKL